MCWPTVCHREGRGLVRLLKIIPLLGIQQGEGGDRTPFGRNRPNPAIHPHIGAILLFFFQTLQRQLTFFVNRGYPYYSDKNRFAVILLP